MNDLPWCLVFLVTILSGDVEPKIVSCGFGQKVSPRTEVFDFIELIFDQAVHGFDVGLPAVGARRDGVMTEAAHLSDRLSKSAIGFGLPVTDELAAIIGLEARVLELHAATQ